MSIRQEYLRAASESRKETSSLKNGFEELNNNEEFLLAITSKGFGKRSSAYEYRISNRGGKGITGIMTSEKNGEVVDCLLFRKTMKLFSLVTKVKLLELM